MARLSSLTHFIEQRIPHTEIEWLPSRNRIFRLVDEPRFVFKMSLDPRNIDDRLRNNSIAKRVCQEKNLHLLIIPQAQKLEIVKGQRSYSFLAQENIDTSSEESVQIEAFYTKAPWMKETAKQMAQLVLAIKFYDVTPRNTPVINDTSGAFDQCRLAMLDLEHSGQVAEHPAIAGFCGNSYTKSDGLIGYLGSEELIDIAINEASPSHNQLPPEIKEALFKKKEERLQEIQSYLLLQQRYQRKKIQGKEPIAVDLKTLDLSLEAKEEWSTFQIKRPAPLKINNEITLKEFAEMVIKNINDSIRNNSDKATTQFKRKALLSIRQEHLKLGNTSPYKHRGSFEELNHENLWIHKVLQALVDKDHIHSFQMHGIGDFLIQA